MGGGECGGAAERGILSGKSRQERGRRAATEMHFITTELLDGSLAGDVDSAGKNVEAMRTSAQNKHLMRSIKKAALRYHYASLSLLWYIHARV